MPYLDYVPLRDDLVRAIKKLKVMGNGFGMIPVGGSYLVQSVPAELNMDHTVVLQLAEVRLSITFYLLMTLLQM